jgi:hypothetical protein
MYLCHSFPPKTHKTNANLVTNYDIVDGRSSFICSVSLNLITSIYVYLFFLDDAVVDCAAKRLQPPAAQDAEGVHHQVMMENI